MSAPPKSSIARNQVKHRCAYCKRPIRWAHSPSGERWAPVNWKRARTYNYDRETKEWTKGPLTYVSHSMTCPEVGRWKGGKTKAKILR